MANKRVLSVFTLNCLQTGHWVRVDNNAMMDWAYVLVMVQRQTDCCGLSCQDDPVVWQFFWQLAAGCLTILEMAVDDRCCPTRSFILEPSVYTSSCDPRASWYSLNLGLGFLSGDHTFAYSFNEVVSLVIVIVHSWWKVGCPQGADSALVMPDIAEPSSISECPNLPKVNDEQPQKSASVKPHSAGSSSRSDCSRLPAADEAQPKKSAAVKPNITEPSSNPDCPSPSPINDAQSNKSASLKPVMTKTFPDSDCPSLCLVNNEQPRNSASVTPDTAEPPSSFECPIFFPSRWWTAQKSLSGTSCNSSSRSDCSWFPAVDKEQPRKLAALKLNNSGSFPSTDCPNSSPTNDEQPNKSEQVKKKPCLFCGVLQSQLARHMKLKLKTNLICLQSWLEEDHGHFVENYNHRCHVTWNWSIKVSPMFQKS